jgi:hypothetical protein
MEGRIMTGNERYYREWLKANAPESRILAAFPEPVDPWRRVEIETDPLGDTITHELDETGEHISIETTGELPMLDVTAMLEGGR